MTDSDKFANIVRYEPRITDPYGNAILIIENFVSIDYGRKVNEVGELTMVLEDKYGHGHFFQPENRIEIWRKINEVSRLDMGATWFITSVTRTINADGSRYVTLDAQDQLCLLDRRTIPYNEGNPTTEKQDSADNVIKAILRENIGALVADTDRDLSTYISIQADVSGAPQVTIFCAKEVVSDVIKEIADTSYIAGTFLSYDFVYRPGSGTFEFQTYTGQRGVDRSTGSDTLILGVEFGSLSTISRIDDRLDEKNYIYAGAKDLVGIVPPQTAFDVGSIALSPFNRKELFLNASDADDEDELQDEADYALNEYKHRLVINATLSEQFVKEQYGEKINYGDKVIVSFDGEKYAAFINMVAVRVDDKGETIDMALSD